MIAVNELTNEVDIVEIKRKTANIGLDVLAKKYDHLCTVIGDFKSFQSNIIGLSMEDM